jgi:succinate dehydrogenase/fumarate reductase-like Fe-S protein
MNNEPMARKLKISILRFNPQERESVPRMVTYEIDEAEGMTLFITDEDFFEVIGDDDGIFGCMSMLGCHDVCPKNLPLATQIAFLRRKMVVQGLK